MAGVSRRGLFSIFTKGLSSARDAAKDGLAAAGPGRGTNAAPPPSPPPAPPRTAPPRRNRPPLETLPGDTDAAGRVRIDLSPRLPISPGASLRIDAKDWAEPFVLVRVAETHWAALTGSCPSDGSDVLFSPEQDCLWCPSCGSRWRLDGTVLRGPTRTRLVSVHAEVLENECRLLP